MNIKHIINIGILSFLSLPIYAIEIPLKTECAGYYSLSLPENIETALYQADEIVKEIKGQKIKFLDNKATYYSDYWYDHLLLKVTTENEKQLISYSKFIKKRMIDFVEQDKSAFSNFTFPVTGIYNDTGLNLLYIDKRLFSFSTGKYKQPSSRNSDYYRNTFLYLLNNFTSRQLFEIPTQQGFCIPYGYIANSSERISSTMGVTYRLVEHPDITLFFKASSSEYDPNPDYWKGSAKDRVKEFWDSTYDTDVKEHHLLGTQRYKSIKIDGRSGKGAFVEIRYKDGRTPDYGYYSLVRLVAEADKDMPELSMYVIGKASESKGKTPLTKDEIYELAKTIESSIKRRVF